MASLTPKQINLSQINSGNEYVDGDGVQPNLFNDCAEGVAYCDEQRQALIQTPDNSEANNVGTPTVSFVDTIVNGRTYKKLKFANLKGAKGDKGDSGVASGTVNSNTPGTSQTDGYTQYAVNNIVSNPNLLINSNFAINQRGKTSYPVTDRYTVDRWRNDGTTCTLATKGVTISVPSAWNFYEQLIEDYANLKGKTVTLTVKISALTYTTGIPSIRIYDGISGGSKNISTVGVHSLTYTVNDNATQLNIRAIFNNSNNSSDIVATIEWAKLEIGSVATEYTPPLIAEELPKCQRYFLPIESGAVRYMNTQIQASLIDFTIPIPQTMRIQPTLVGNTLTVYKLENGAVTAQEGFTFAIIAKSSSSICIRATKASHGLTNAILGISTTVYADAEI